MQKAKMMGLIRHILTAVGGAAVMYGYADDGQIAEIVGGVMTAIGVAWSAAAPEKKVAS